MRITLFVILSLFSVQIFAQDLSEKEIRNDIQYFQKYLSELDNISKEHYDLIYSWVLKGKMDSTELKIRLLYYLESDTINQIYNRLMEKRYFLSNDLLMSLVDMSKQIHSITQESRYITSVLSSKDSYEDPFIIFAVQPKVEYGGSVNLASNEIHNNVELLRVYCDFLDNQKKVKPVIDNNLKDQSKYSLIIELFELCNLRLEINDYISKISKRGYWYLDSERELVESGIYKRLVDYYHKRYTIDEVNELKRFYLSGIGVKTLKSNGFISLQLFETILDEEIDN